MELARGNIAMVDLKQIAFNFLNKVDPSTGHASNLRLKFIATHKRREGIDADVHNIAINSNA